MQETRPAMVEIWGITWTTQGNVWIGPAIADPEDPMLKGAVDAQRIIRQDGRYVMVDSWLTLDRFTWEEGDVEPTETHEEDG
jgi:hypothetical protein